MIKDENNPDIPEGGMVLDYRVCRIEYLEMIDSVLYLLEHAGTGARHLHISNRDRENTFSVAFRTVPSDSTGVAHILEHTVLCGSETFPVRDPFFSMLKRGLSTFMNAFTASDWTMYPFSTQNRKDYYNLMDVYLDAAFFPALDELSFKQEGHRLELVPSETDPEASQLVYTGVVYNEMKGAMSSPSQILGRSLLKSLYPDTTYGFNSGGEPRDIPSLTHEGLRTFHSRFYHPSNAFFYTYGSLPLKDHLAVIQGKVLNRFSRIDPDSTVVPQPRWKSPRKETAFYPLAKEEDAGKKYQSCVAWLTADVRDSFEVLVLTVLEQVLLGNASSPLRKALIDSGLGSALSDASGFDPDMRDSLFACGLKDVDADAAEAVEEIVFSTLAGLADQGIEKSLIDSAVHQIEFHRKEITNTPHPYGIKLVLSLVGPWIHEGDPVAAIDVDQDLERLRREIDAGGFLEQKLRQYFLDNPHRVLFTLAPDQEMESRQDLEVRAELNRIMETLSDDEIEAIKADTRKLEELQDSKEDLSCLPTLGLADVPPEVEIIKPDFVADQSSATCYDKPTSGILYFSCPTGLGKLSSDMLYLVPFFCRAFAGSGTARRDYSALAELIDLYTGGLSISPFAGTGFADHGACMPFLALQGKALERNVEHLFDLVSECVTEYSFNDLKRLKSLLLQYRAGMESSIVSSGHSYAMSLAARNFSQASFLGEMWHGIYQYNYIKSLTDRLASAESEDAGLEQLSRELKTIAARLFTSGNLRPVLAGEADVMKQADDKIARMLKALPVNGNEILPKDYVTLDKDLPWEGWSTSTSVSFVAQAFKTVRLGHKDAPALSVIAKMLRSLFLHREIREKGGAYGGFSLYNPEEGIFSFGSYRDPHIRRTLDAYERARGFIAGGDYSETDVKEAILQVCSDIDKPETPGPSALKAFYRNLLKLTDERRQQFKASLLQLNKAVIQTAAEKYFMADSIQKGCAVISSREKLEEANRDNGNGHRPLDLFRL